MQKSKIILISGASSGIGKETAIQLLKDGHIVYGAARRVQKMAEFARYGGRAMQMDITQDVDRRGVIDTILKRHGTIDVLINNAGYGVMGTVEETPIAQAKKQFEVNLFGLARLTQLALPTMRHNRSGKIINVSSIVGRSYFPTNAWYVASKHALEGWSDCLRAELLPFGIAVVIITPGIIRTEFQREIIPSKLSYYSQFITKFSTTYDAQEQGRKSAPPPLVIARLIQRAVKRNRPKIRYVGGKHAFTTLFLRKIIPDRWLDRLNHLFIRRIKHN